MLFIPTSWWKPSVCCRVFHRLFVTPFLHLFPLHQKPHSEIHRTPPRPPSGCKEVLLVWFPVAAGRRCLPTVVVVVSMLQGPEGDAPERAVLRRLLQPELRDEMPTGHRPRSQVFSAATSAPPPPCYRSAALLCCLLSAGVEVTRWKWSLSWGPAGVLEGAGQWSQTIISLTLMGIFLCHFSSTLFVTVALIEYDHFIFM